ncbi:MAG: right-handed parallel beta-helix repeat-containing protein, partial [Candidatus Dadabacteria bacterium]|nr:right-handed parallel beta-helix repeat-containing protein [Candidatus Dadabacteria bacterium]
MTFSKSNILFRIITLTVATTFLWQQISWAGDLQTNLIDETLGNLEAEQSQTFSPEYLRDQQASIEDVIEQAQFIEDTIALQDASAPSTAASEPPAEEPYEPEIDLVGPKTAAPSQYDSGTPEGSGAILEEAVTEPPAPDDSDNGAILSITTHSGDTIHYRGGLIDRIDRADGVALSGIVLDSTGGLVDADITAPDGTIQRVRAGKVTEIALPDRNIYRYDADERIDYITHPDATITDYDYTTPGETTLTHNGEISHYDGNGLLTRVTKNDDSEVHYSNGIITSVLTPQGAEYIFNIEEADGLATARVSEVVYAGGSTTRHVYAGGSIAQAIAASSAGDTVRLHEGVWREHIVLKSGVSIVGEGMGATVIDGLYKPHSHVITAQGCNTIEGITITGGGPYKGNPSSALKITGTGVTIRRCEFRDNLDYGVYVWSGENVVIEECLFKNNHVAIQLPKTGNIIRYNTIVDSAIGVNILSGAAPHVYGNIITGSSYQSIYEFAWGIDPTMGYAIVEGNTVFNNRERGGKYGKCLPPALERRELGNIVADPGFTDPASEDYSIAAGSQSYSRGAFIPEAMRA